MLPVLILGIIIEITVLGLIIIALKWEKLFFFFHKRETFFKIFFIALYFLEQVVFITISYFYSDYISLLVGFFALVVLSTVSLQGVMMESKNRKANEKVEAYHKESNDKITKIRDDYEVIIDKIRGYVESLEIENYKLKLKNNIKTKI